MSKADKLIVERFFSDLETHGGFKKVDEGFDDEDYQPEDEIPAMQRFVKKPQGVKVGLLLCVTYDLTDSDGPNDMVDADLISIDIVKSKEKDYEIIENLDVSIDPSDFYPSLTRNLQAGFNRIRDMVYDRSGETNQEATKQQKKYIHGMVEAIGQFGVLTETLTSDQIQRLTRHEAHLLIQRLLPAYNAVYNKYKESKRKK